MVDVTKIFSDETLDRWKTNFMEWEYFGEVDANDYAGWIENLNNVFAEELNGTRIDEETVLFWKKQLASATKQRVKELQKEAAALDKADKRREIIKIKFFDLRAKGIAVAEIARTLKVETTELIEIVNNARQDELLMLENVNRVRIEALIEKNGIRKAQRIQLLGGQYNKIMKELEKRKFDDVPTERLLDMALKYSQILKNEDSDLVITKQVQEYYGPPTRRRELKI